ncbi:hypothetical protein Tsubulata_034196 [Turnera subulata]|uniref:Apyrase 6 n=1 Tax=Turnera subulata TaxID=218843 RepID=A0A9Q0FZV9_9ROSI|nr:hypothetical protein Tsubulata_034196 [Turnera subulata]
MRRLHARTRLHPTTSDNNNMDPIKLHLRPPPSASRSKPKSQFQSSSSTTTTVTALLSLSLTLLALYFFLSSPSTTPSRTRYGIIIDGGSTGTRIHVFSSRLHEHGKPVFDFGPDGSFSFKVNPGLSSYARHPEAAAGSLNELLEFARGKVPQELWAETEIRLMATAGLRLLDPGVQDRILQSCRGVLRESGFRFRDDWAAVISGSDEGVFAWVVANYALGSLGGDPSDTTGIIELGGASAQVTFVSREPVPSEFLRTVKFGNVTYNIYSHSFLHFGQASFICFSLPRLNAAFEALRESLVSGDYRSASKSLEKGMFLDPCTPVGYSPSMESSQLPFSGPSTENSRLLSSFYSRGNFSECRSAALMLLQKGKEKCQYQHCTIGSTFIPKIQGRFLATENFFHTSKFFGLRQKGFLSDLIIAGRHFCGEEWSRLKSKHQALDDEVLMNYCFSSAYIVALLHDSLGIAVDDERQVLLYRIAFANHVGNIPLDWALGAFILQSGAAAVDLQQPDWIATVISDDSPTLISLIGISIVLTFVAWSISKWRKPELKTVYDLEKGRYIVTRVGRSS